MIVHVVENVRNSEAHEVIVVLGHEAERVKSALEDLDILLCMNESYAEGMSTSIHAGVSASSPDAAGFMICLSDLPLIESDEYNVLIRHFLSRYQANRQAIVVPMHQGVRGNPVLLSATHKEAMLAQQGIVGCRSVVKQNPDHVAHVEMVSDHVVRDVDTPDAYRAISGTEPENS